MAHRGRLNVLAHILQKPYAQILAEFKDPVNAHTLRLDLGWMGDVKYHAGRRARPRRAARCTSSMAPNPSHLEAVNPVVVGMARAAGTVRERAGHAAFRRRQHAADPDSRRRGVPGPGHRRRDAEPVAARRLRHRRHDPHHRQQPARLHRHADGVLQHQLRQRPGARLQDSDRPRQRRRSDRVPRGGAAGLGVSRAVPARLPDRPGRLPPARPQRGRRAGVHAAGHVQDGRRAPDGPRTVRAVARSKQGTLTADAADGAGEEALRDARADVRVAQARTGLRRADSRAGSGRHRRQDARPACRSQRLREINDALLTAPEGFTFHKKLERGRERRKTLFADPNERTHRLVGGRGTGVRDDPRRRHADPPDRRRRRARHVQPSPRRVPRRRDRARCSFRCRTSRRRRRRSRSTTARSARTPPSASSSATTSRNRAPGALGSAVRRLHQRRAGHARPVRDVRPRQVGTASRRSSSCCRTATKAPGPEHSSARPERILQAAADINLRLVNCTTAAQYFHLLRRQAALLDHRSAAALRPHAEEPAAQSARRVVAGRARGRPFPVGDRRCRRADAGEEHQAARAVQRQGLRRSDQQRAPRRGEGSRDLSASSSCIRSPRPRSREVLDGYTVARGRRLAAGRAREHGRVGVHAAPARGADRATARRCATSAATRSSSPSEGSSAWHQLNQRVLVEQAFDLESHASEGSMVLSKPVRRLTGSKR